MMVCNEKIGEDYWYISEFGDVTLARYKTDDMTRDLVAIGNYFDTAEEAEKAVKKLEAWKRLKDKGFDFKGWAVKYGSTLTITATFNDGGIVDDLNLLFGGEE